MTGISDALWTPPQINNMCRTHETQNASTLSQVELFRPHMVCLENVLGMLQSLPGRLENAPPQRAPVPIRTPPSRRSQRLLRGGRAHSSPTSCSGSPAAAAGQGAGPDSVLSKKRRAPQQSPDADDVIPVADDDEGDSDDDGYGFKTAAPFARLWLQRFVELGYNVKMSVLSAASFGAPQRRGRVLFFATRFGAKCPSDHHPARFI